MQFYDSGKIKFNLHGPVNLHENSASEFCCVESIFSMKLLGFVSKAMKLLLTELVGQCRNILPLALPTERQYILALTSNSVNKSIVLTYFDQTPSFSNPEVSFLHYTPNRKLEGGKPRSLIKVPQSLIKMPQRKSRGFHLRVFGFGYGAKRQPRRGRNLEKSILRGFRNFRKLRVFDLTLWRYGAAFSGMINLECIEASF